MISWTDLVVREALAIAEPGVLPPTTYSEITTDTRSMQAGALFVALKGERFDGHAFAAQAVAAGATPHSPVSDQWYGDRVGSVQDPSGIIWYIARPA